MNARTHAEILADVLADVAADNQRAVIGDNAPPPTAPTLFEAATKAVEDARLEAGNWLDGAPVASQEQADWLSGLLDMVKAAEKLTDGNRKTENEPFDCGKAEVQARYNPLLKQADTIKVTLQAALTPWRNKAKAEKDAAARADQAEADRLAMIAIKARQTMDASNLAEREQAEALVAAAEAAQRQAAKAAKPTASGLRTVWQATLIEPHLYLKHLRETDAIRLKLALAEMAAADVRAGARVLPGVEIVEVRVAR